MNILLVGMPGSGKTTIGKKLSQILNYKFIELDHLLAKGLGLSGLASINSKKLLDLREYELVTSKDLSLDDRQVIACSSGFVENQLNVQYFKTFSTSVKVIYLFCPLEVLINRSFHNKKIVRNISTANSFEESFRKKRRLFKLMADLEVDTNTNSEAEVLRQIMIGLQF